MSEKGHHSPLTREERLAAQLRANLRRRKTAARKAVADPQRTLKENDLSPDKPSP